MIKTTLDKKYWLFFNSLYHLGTKDLQLSRLELVCIIWFTFEYILRFMGAPKKLAFIKNGMNIIDVLAILPYFVSVFCEYAKSVYGTPFYYRYSTYIHCVVGNKFASCQEIKRRWSKLIGYLDNKVGFKIGVTAVLRYG